MITIYGIKNCDTVKKARKWLDENGYDYYFHDFRQDGIETSIISKWVEHLGWEKVVNKRSTTWRNLSDKEKAISNNKQAVKILSVNPTLIKRPVVETKSGLLIGFKESEFKNL